MLDGGARGGGESEGPADRGEQHDGPSHEWQATAAQGDAAGGARRMWTFGLGQGTNVANPCREDGLGQRRGDELPSELADRALAAGEACPLQMAHAAVRIVRLGTPATIAPCGPASRWRGFGGARRGIEIGA
jgi:hypothetical protein